MNASGHDNLLVLAMLTVPILLVIIVGIVYVLSQLRQHKSERLYRGLWREATPAMFTSKTVGYWAIMCHRCGTAITADNTYISELRKVAITAGWLIGDGYQHCPKCREL